MSAQQTTSLPRVPPGTAGGHCRWTMPLTDVRKGLKAEVLDGAVVREYGETGIYRVLEILEPGVGLL